MASINPIEMMTPIQSIGSIDGVNNQTGTSKVAGPDIFKDILESAVNNVTQTDNASVNDTELLATGDVDDLHTLSIDNMKSYLAVDMLVQMRNKALDSYSQIMQINV